MKEYKVRVKDEEKNYQDYQSIEEAAEDLGINKGTINKYIANKKSFLGLRFSLVEIVNKPDKPKNTKKTKTEVEES